MKKLSFLITTVLAFSLFLVGCGNSASETQGAAEGEEASSDGNPKVSVVLKAFNSEYWRIVERGAKDAGEEFGVDVQVMAPADETEVEKQVSLIQDQITLGVDALVLAPSQPTTVLTALQQYKDNNIPVFFIDSDAEYPEKASFIGTENRDAGKLGGEFLGEKLNKGDKVAIIRGQLGSTTHDERTEGAKEALEAAGLEVATIQPADSDRAKALAVMENIIQTNPDIKAVFCTSETMALGALRAVTGKDIMVVGFDGTTEGLESVQAGGLIAEVAQNPYMMGYLGVEAAAKKLNGEEIEKRIDSGAEVITKENVDGALGAIKEYTSK